MEPGEWNAIGYTQGLFCCAKSDTGSESDVVAFSRDGFHWRYKLLSAGNERHVGILAIPTESKFMVVIAGQQQTARITYGTQAKARAIVGSGRIGSFMIHDVGAGYTSAPTVTVHDTQNTSDVTTDAKIANGVLGQPRMVNPGTDYFRSSAEVTAGDGYAEIRQIADELILENVSRQPGPGDNISINGIDGVTYFVVKILESTWCVGCI